jgi:hypothetical protein
VFRVTSIHATEFADEDPEIRVFFSYLGWPSGEVRLAVPMVLASREERP